MFRILTACTFLASTGASRIQADTASKIEWPGSSCEDLQRRFQNRLADLRETVEAIDVESDSELSTITRVRITTRMLGLIRTTRRARDCSWLLENDGDDLEEMRGVTSTLLAANPCAEAARSEMEAGNAIEHTAGQAQSLSRAISLLMSDDCELAESDQEEEEVDISMVPEAPEEQLEEAEDELQGRLNDLLEDQVEGAFIQLESHGPRSRGIAVRLGVFFIILFLMYLCFNVFALVAVFLTYFLLHLGGQLIGVNYLAHSGLVNPTTFQTVFGNGLAFLAAASFPVGMMACAYGTYRGLWVPTLNPTPLE